MNQSMTKSKVTIIALLAIVVVCLLFVVSIVEIRLCYKYRKEIASQEQQIKSLQNQKDYYKDKLADAGYGEDDLIFEVE